MLSFLFTAVYAVICLLLLVVVLMQQGKGGGIAAGFGGSGSETAFGARAGASVLTRATTVLGALFMIGAMTLAILGQRDTSSVLSGVEGPGLEAPAPVSVPVEIDPALETPDQESADPTTDPQ
ncbi:MAG: preprotein translocase subunit SecG [Acidobacteria bacterium]|nr:MAG: preprotein translocase subunit SecG [Acidobacteriota bacterium]